MIIPVLLGLVAATGLFWWRLHRQAVRMEESLRRAVVAREEQVAKVLGARIEPPGSSLP